MLTVLRQELDVRKSDAYADAVEPSYENYVEDASTLEDDLNNIRSQLHNLLKTQTGNWYDDIDVPTTLGTGSKRGVNALNNDLHVLEKKRVLVSVDNLSDVTVASGQNFVILGSGELPAEVTAAIGAVTTLGTVAAYNSTFGTHSLAAVGGATVITPKNLCRIVDADLRVGISSGGRPIFGLIQSESNADGSSISASAPNRLQISFVRLNPTGDGLEPAPAADIENRIINYASTQRKSFEGVDEQDFLNPGSPAAASSTGSETLLIDMNTAASHVGHAVVVDSNDTAADSNAGSISTANVIGFVQVVGPLGTGKVQTGGKVLGAKFVSGLTLSAGDRVFISATGGKLTNTIVGLSSPSVRMDVGVVANAASYAIDQTAAIVFLPKEPVVL